jgi:SnoaL-like domain
MPLTIEDRLAIGDLICRHGHLIDAGELDRLDELFTSDVVYDVSDFTGESLLGLEAIREAALALGERNPLGHHVTNLVMSAEGEDEVTAHSKGIGVNRTGARGRSSTRTPWSEPPVGGGSAVARSAPGEAR